MDSTCSREPGKREQYSCIAVKSWKPQSTPRALLNAVLSVLHAPRASTYEQTQGDTSTVQVERSDTLDQCAFRPADSEILYFLVETMVSHHLSS